MRHPRHLVRASLPLFVGAVAVAGLSASCTKLVAVDLTVVEPCGQENQALNGVQSFRMLSSGAAADGDNVVAFRASDPAGMAVGLGPGVVITVEGYSDDITLTDNPTAPPETVKPTAVGRTMPLVIDETTAAIKGTILAGKVDSFGAPRGVDGNCTAMDNGGAIAGRHGHTVTYLPTLNKVLIFGGAVWADDDGAQVETFLRSAEVFDPTTGTFTALPEARNPRAYHSATALPDGRVLVWGGLSTLNGVTSTLRNAEIIDIRQANPYVGTILTKVSRAHHTATLLGDAGLLVVVGGCTGGVADGCSPNSASAGSTAVVPSVELVNINGDLTQTEAATGSLAIPRAMHQAVGFPAGNSGVIAIVGGLNSSGALSGVEILQVDNGNVANRNSTADALPHAFVRHQATVLNPSTQTFVVTGGQDQAPAGALSAQAAGSTDMITCSLVDAVVTCNAGPSLQSPRFGHAMARLRDGTLVVIGGVAPATAATAEGLRTVPGTGEFAWTATAGALAVPRDRAAFTLLGGDTDDAGFVNQVFYSGGHSITAPFVTSNATDIYFGR